MPDRFMLWGWHRKVGRWSTVLFDLRGVPGDVAVQELTVRQDRLRRSEEPCRLVVLPVGENPADRWPSG